MSLLNCHNHATGRTVSVVVDAKYIKNCRKYEWRMDKNGKVYSLEINEGKPVGLGPYIMHGGLELGKVYFENNDRRRDFTEKNLRFAPRDVEKMEKAREKKNGGEPIQNALPQESKEAGYTLSQEKRLMWILRKVDPSGHSTILYEGVDYAKASGLLKKEMNGK